LNVIEPLFSLNVVVLLLEHLSWKMTNVPKFFQGFPLAYFWVSTSE